jgi:hypothetical protein
MRSLADTAFLQGEDGLESNPASRHHQNEKKKSVNYV